ncbi:hypothetical protein [Lewinella sp. IMCC34183]|uniref:hypothetical protein n=1 Tax=Lewinella sp. IMCC34183 TaxID=2248762 RepID=UPI000E242774|nr:hypothetical protein [Lewinella sp. IMCC34183]
MKLLPLLLLLAAVAHGQPSLFDALHARKDTAVLSLETEWDQLLHTKSAKEYQPLTLSHGGQRLAGRIRTRGHARLRACRYPSLKVKLEKDALASMGYSVLNDLKFVVACNSGTAARGYLRRERLMYELHALVSSYHHRTVPVRLALPGGDTLPAFLIEAEEQLESRYGASRIAVERISTRAFERQAYANLALFNYLILNTDWQLRTLHNVEALRRGEESGYIPIPYDFDYAGLVDTDYALPRESLGQVSVQEPHFLGRGLRFAELRTAADGFLAQRESLENAVRDHPTLQERHRRIILRRLKTFFAQIANDRELERLASR